MHIHVIAGDFGYLPVYSDETGYRYWSEAREGLKDYINSVVDSVEGSETIDEFDTYEDYWLATGVVRHIGTNGIQETIQAVFDRDLASIDYAEVTICYEDCMTESPYS